MLTLILIICALILLSVTGLLPLLGSLIGATARGALTLFAVLITLGLVWLSH